MPNNLSTFLRDESGATVVAWTTLTAGMMTLSMVLISSIGGGTLSLAEKSKEQLESTYIGNVPAEDADKAHRKREETKEATQETERSAETGKSTAEKASVNTPKTMVIAEDAGIGLPN